ncbi:hypothetical protein NPIL_248761 [Nephila pilipes]|uniref:Uncharacterized protein n=1 Tax=Nephila pilipes TaxID=299642 RepID=A0A8X6NTI8_NEPPI|nr:hypothetical protein NPIL_248761 [Nephila pilipes]
MDGNGVGTNKKTESQHKVQQDIFYRNNQLASQVLNNEGIIREDEVKKRRGSFGRELEGRKARLERRSRTPIIRSNA